MDDSFARMDAISEAEMFERSGCEIEAFGIVEEPSVPLVERIDGVCHAIEWVRIEHAGARLLLIARVIEALEASGE